MHKIQQRGYSAYGLKIRSEVPLTEFRTAVFRTEDVLVTYREKDFHSEGKKDIPEIDIDGAQARFCFPGVAVFHVIGGNSIIIEPEPTISASLLRLYVEGMLMGMILHQRGACVLHSSVFEHQGSAVVLLGHVGAGKSTLAAAMYRRGHRILADDNAAISITKPGLRVLPSFPFVKLFPAVAETLQFADEDLGVLDSSMEKKSGRVADRFSEDPLALGRIYVLGRHFGPEITPLSRLSATMELIRNSIPTRWGHKGDGTQLRLCAAVASQVPVFTLRTFSELRGIGAVADQLELHLGAKRSSTPNPGVESGAALTGV